MLIEIVADDVLRRVPLNRGMRLVSVCCVVGMLVAGCGAGSSGSSSQVVAKVNDQEITVSQLNQVLRITPPAASEDATVKQALDSLVEEELLVQKAMQDKLDRDPVVMQAIAKARRQVLAQAYVERNILPKGIVPEAEVRAYFTANPALFEQRRVYKLDVFILPRTQLTVELKSALNSPRTSQQVRELLAVRGIPFEYQQTSTAAEEVPLEVLPQFASAAVGDLLIANRGPDKAALMALSSIVESPRTFEQAKPAILSYLKGNRGQRALQDYLKQARAGAQISYERPVAAPTAPAPATPDKPGDSAYMEKGLSGLN